MYGEVASLSACAEADIQKQLARRRDRKPFIVLGIHGRRCCPDIPV
jgi:hypothetical protein